MSLGLQDAFAGSRCYVIAEAGSNHDHDLDVALEMVDVAARSGADAIKFQLFSSQRLYARGAGIAEYLGTEAAIEDVIAAVELDVSWIPELSERAHERGIDFLATPFDEDAVEALEPFVPALKVASYELTHDPLLRRVARAGKPILLSTGASTLEEVERAVGVLLAAGGGPIGLMQCTAAYPAPLSAMNLGAITTMRARFGLPVGLSDHSREPLVAPVAAVALGAAFIEKHFTLSNARTGPDHRFSLEPAELQTMVTAVRQAETSLGAGEKIVLPEELELRRFARRSIFTIVDVDAGVPFTPDNVAVLRHGTLPVGLPPSSWEDVLGGRSRQALAAFTPLAPDDVV
jgi:N-acetylneuraminate synthase